MKNCKTCLKWLVKKENSYENGEVIVKWKSKDGEGNCCYLNVATKSDFGCNEYKPGGPLVETRYKSGEPWHHSVAGPCPDCKKPYCQFPDCHYHDCPGPNKCLGYGAMSTGEDRRCRGTGTVLYYDDGYIGENSTRRHPKEQELRNAGLYPQEGINSTCHKCGNIINEAWNVCPNCGFRLRENGTTVILSDKEAGLGGLL